MRDRLKPAILIVSIVAMTAAIGCPEEGTQQPPPPASPPATQPATQQATPPPPPTEGAGGDLGTGKRIYLTACANCHGPDGTGAMMRQALPKIGDLTSPEMHARMSDEAILQLIETGRDKMPGFGGMFTPEQKHGLVKYVRTMKRQQ